MKAWTKQTARPLAGLVTTLFLVMTLLSGCVGQPAQKAVQSGPIDTYTIADPRGDWGFPSPWGHYQRGPGYLRMSFLYDTLIWKDEQGFTPALASHWSYDEGTKAYRFALRDDALWHDGQKVTAGDVLFTFEYMKKHPYPWVDLSEVEKVEAVDAQTVQITLKRHYAPFLENVAGALPILPRHIWAAIERPEEHAEKEVLIGSGPYRLVDYSKEHGTYLYQANDRYYGGKPKVAQIRFVKLNESMAAAALTKGEVDAAQIPGETAEQMRQVGMQVIRGPHFWNAKLMFNHQKAPFSDKAFRQALAYTIDRQELVAKSLRGQGAPASPGLIPPDSPWHEPQVTPYTADLEKARELLASLGYFLEQGSLVKECRELSLELLCSPDNGRDGEIIKEQLARIGIKVRVKSLEAKTVDAKVGAWDFDLAVSGHGGIGGDPQFFSRMITGQGFLSARYNDNSRLNALLNEQLSAMDEEKRKEQVREAQRIYAEDLPALSLYYPTDYWCHNGKVNLFYTQGGISVGIPLPLNKLAFVRP
ncbi:ABC transporter substrate-binding protein [Heliomicrobium modesticaldum]|nr:ABC transporter substrate-binding protein [Heliomicrobium modesticaldum]